MGSEITFTDANFQNEVLESDIPVLVDFWATWCHPCRMLTPVIEEIAEEYKGKAKIGKLNAEENPNMTGQYGVISIPTLIIFKNGKPIDQITGAVPKDMIIKKLDNVLSKE
jgi:thioredoxin 1